MKVKHGFKYKKDGWTYIHIEGKPYQRGIAHGKLLKNEIKDAIKTMEWRLYDSHGFKIDFFVDLSNYIFKKKIEEHFHEFFEELKGIAKGADVNLDKLVLWNNLFSLEYALPKIKEYLNDIPSLKEKYGKLFNELPVTTNLEGGYNGARDKCSSFLAVGDYTHDGQICCGHNTFDDFIDGQWFSVIIDIKPKNGNRILFQSAPGLIYSQTDFFINDKGFIGTETTIGGFINYTNKDPIMCRIRNAMQYANTLDDYVDMLKKENSGDYANSWLIGDTKNNEIMRIELGLEFVNVERKKNGYFIGFNAPYDASIRNIECVNTGFDDIRRHQGARKVRLEQLIEQYKGKLNIEIGKRILADHYDVYLNKTNPCSRTCCSHYDLDDRAYMSQSDRPLPYQPRGCVDGCVADTESCKKLTFYARWGSSCGMPFNVKQFMKQNIQWKRFEPYLFDRPHQPWGIFKCLNTLPHANKTISKKNKRENNKTKKIKI